MPRCRRDQNKFGRFLLAIVVIESLFVYFAMTWEHQSAEVIADQIRQKRRREREMARRKEHNLPPNLKGAKFLSDRDNFDFNNYKLIRKQDGNEEENFDFESKRSGFQLGNNADRFSSFNGELRQRDGVMSDSSHIDSVKKSGVMPKPQLIADAPLDGQNAGKDNSLSRNEGAVKNVKKPKHSGFLSFLKNKHSDQSVDAKFLGDMYELRGSML